MKRRASDPAALPENQVCIASPVPTPYFQAIGSASCSIEHRKLIYLQPSRLPHNAARGAQDPVLGVGGGVNPCV